MRVVSIMSGLSLAIAGIGLSAGAAAQTAASRDPVRLKHQDQRQYGSEPATNRATRNTRCRIVRQKGQDRRVCGQPTNYAKRR